MRAKLVRGALQVFGERGIDGSVIDDLIRTAGVSRGTFYNYFRTNEELLMAVSLAISDALMRIVDPLARTEPDPAARIAAGMRLLHVVLDANPDLCAFIARGGMRILSANGLVMEYLPRDLQDGMAAGRFRIGSVELGFDLVAGPSLAAAERLRRGPVPADYPVALARSVLLSLGVPDVEATEIAQRPLPPLPPAASGSILLPPDDLTE